MPIYEGVNGVVRKRKEWPVGINGVVRQQKEHWAGIDGVQRKIFSKGTVVGSLPVGSICQIEESGSPTDYIVVHQGLPSSIYDASCNGTWLLRKDISTTTSFSDSGKNAYETSDVLFFLDAMFIMRLPDSVQDALFQKNPKIPYMKGGGLGGLQTGANGLSSRVFLLSGYEVGFSTSVNSKFPVDGAKLDYFLLGGNDSNSSKKRVANYNGSAYKWMLRSPVVGNTAQTWGVGIYGVNEKETATLGCGVRPAFILPADFEI